MKKTFLIRKVSVIFNIYTEWRINIDKTVVDGGRCQSSPSGDNNKLLSTGVTLIIKKKIERF